MRLSFRARLAREVQDTGGGTFDFLDCLRRVLHLLDGLDKSGTADCDAIHRELDGLVDGPLFDFAEARGGLLALYGFGPYARVIGEFTRSERMVNRAWSASVDGYPGEARASVARARELFAELIEELEKLEQQSSR
jgi:hypothetical protein